MKLFNAHKLRLKTVSGRLWPVSGFVISASAALIHNWSLPAFCWSAWLAGLWFSLTAVVVAIARIFWYVQRLTTVPLFKRLSLWQFKSVMGIGAIALGLVMAYIYAYLFAFYGVFLSFFASMEPDSLFGVNSFINSDFISPIFYLTERYWPMLVGVALANMGCFTRSNPWHVLIMPFEGNHIVRIHLMIVVMPFLALIAWALLPHSYQPLVVIALMGLFYLLPDSTVKKDEPNDSRVHHYFSQTLKATVSPEITQPNEASDETEAV